MKWIDEIATLGPIGRMKYAPGTWGSLVAALGAFGLAQLGPLFYLGMVVLLVPWAIWICEQYVRSRSDPNLDPKEVVIDEVLGCWVALTWLPTDIFIWILGFLLFRALDILKPWPIGLFDRHVKGGVGIVADDLAAGILVNIFLQWLVQNGYF
jgi:phosphatidylglycerophosphatase A